MAGLIRMCNAGRHAVLRGIPLEFGTSGLTLVEIGSYSGESAAAFLDSGAVERIYCVDPWRDGYDPGDLASPSAAAAERAFDARFSGDSRVVKVKGTIDDFVKLYGKDVVVDGVYVDACHQYAHVLHDITTVLHDVRPRMFIAGHDYDKEVRIAVDNAIGPVSRTYPDRSWLLDLWSLSHMWDRFDRVIVLAFTGYRDRIPPLMAELERVGLGDRAELFWNFPSPFDAKFMSAVPRSSTVRKPSHFNEVMGHYRALKTGFGLGDNHVLVLEDDVRFIRNLPVLAEQLRLLPDDYDVAKLEWFCHKGGPAAGDKPYWAQISGFDTAGGAAVAYSRKGMQWKITEMERAADGGMLFVNDRYDTQSGLAGLRAYVAMPLLAVQDPAYHATSNYTVPRGSYHNFLASGEFDAYGAAKNPVAAGVKSTGLPGIDMVCVLCRPMYYHDRGGELVRELKRVGISDFHRIWNPDSRFIDRLRAVLPASGCVRNPGSFRCLFGHYTAMKSALDLGVSTMLMLEDDVRFIKDVQFLHSALSSVPDDFHFAKLAWGTDDKVDTEDRIGGVWVCADRFGTFDTTAILWSARGMRWYVDLVERGLASDKPVIRLADRYFSPDLYGKDVHGFVSVPMLAVSKGYPRRMTRWASISGQSRKYGPYLADGGLESYMVD